MTLEGETSVEGPWVDRLNGLENAQVDIVTIRAPDGHGRSVMFTVESVDDTAARARSHGAELIGEVVQYQDPYRLCYMRGPAGIIVTLAEELF